jgi:hypothetical protein
MTDINDVEKQVYEIASKFAFIEKVETLLKTPNTLKIKLSIENVLFSLRLVEKPKGFFDEMKVLRRELREYIFLAGE